MSTRKTKVAQLSAAPATAEPEFPELEPVWDFGRFENERRFVLDNYLRAVRLAATLYSNGALRDEVIRLSFDLNKLIKSEEVDEEALEGASNSLDELIADPPNCGFGKLSTAVLSVLTDAPGVTLRRLPE